MEVRTVGQTSFREMPRPRFRLYSFLVVLAAIVAFVVTTPAVHHWYTWRPRRAALVDWAASLERQPDQHEAKLIQMPNGQWLSVQTSEVDIAADGTTTYSGQPIRSDGFYVVPPGQWVDNISEVIPLWQEHLNK